MGESGSGLRNGKKRRARGAGTTRLSLSLSTLHTFRGRMLLAGALAGPAAGLVGLCGWRGREEGRERDACAAPDRAAAAEREQKQRGPWGTGYWLAWRPLPAVGRRMPVLSFPKSLTLFRWPWPEGPVICVGKETTAARRRRRRVLFTRKGAAMCWVHACASVCADGEGLALCVTSLATAGER